MTSIKSSICSMMLIPLLALATGCSMLSSGDDSQLEAGDFEMPDSVTIDLTGEVPAEKSDAATVPEQASAQTSDEETQPDQPESAAPVIQDADSAAVLARLNQPGQEPLTRDPEQVQQAELARSDFNRAVAELRKGNLDTAQARFRDLATQYPALSGPIVNQAIVLRKKGNIQEAYDLLQKSILQHGKNPRLLNELGVLSRQLGKFRQAQVSYESAIRIDENYAPAHYNLAVLADLYLHDPVLALKEFETYQTLLPEPDKKVNGWIIELQRRAARTQ
ncbi:MULTISPECIES: tetratricopeptide repeat protein [unclassified Ketobacter]|uniref:tetratricopeptide repeat protein n=1 Tax=unclassified Ketobacter TaxID=2639109 RepID=UPI000EC3FAE0|nr:MULTISPECIES: tetratricopeptide repeat protein [unclassified Ketobacter]RLT88848.1 MAG: hypothetical protein D9N13_16970 [Ketobacter sp. GenoA1]RLT97551.1 MAG: hypothetical protein D9N15_06970 [Ketobacter sp.]HCB38496.1 hypothetical protein [Gammaproteobacteria bacterium]